MSRPDLGIGEKHRLASLPGVLVLAGLSRIALLCLAGADVPLTGDEQAYHQIAVHFAQRRGLYQTNNPFFPGQMLHAWQAPLYPLLLGVTYRVAGPSLILAKLWGVAVGTAMVYVVYDLALRVFRGTSPVGSSRPVAFAAACIVALYPGLLTNGHLLLSETLFTFWVLLAFDCVARAFDATPARRANLWLAAAGAAWGLATLTRGVTLYFTPVVAAWVGWCVWRDAVARGAARWPLVRGVASAALIGCVALAPIAPYTLRNYAVFQQFVLLETKGGVNLWLGNSPDTPPEFIRNVWKAGVREPILDALPREEVARDRVAYTLALQHIRAEPMTFLARMPIKWVDFWGFERNLVDNAEATIQGGGWHSPSKLAADLSSAVAYVFVVLCGVVGFVYARDDRWKAALGGFAVYFVMIHLVIFGDGRFHLPLIPLLGLYAGWMLAEASRGRNAVLRQIEPGTTRAGIAVVLVASLIAAWGREAWAAWEMLRGGS